MTVRQEWTEPVAAAVTELYRRNARVLGINDPEVVELAGRLGLTRKQVATATWNCHAAHREPGVYPGKLWHYAEIWRRLADQ